ncbi:MAG: cation transporter [Clostridiales bacterium]|nr:cation transporter [Clostridiales bacterium]
MTKNKKELSREKIGKISSIVGILANVILSVCKIVVGIVSGFISILADGLNNLSDCGSSAVAYVSFKMSSKPADKEHPYGHERIEYISSMAVAFVILIIAFELAKESIMNIISPKALEFSVIAVVVLALSILVKVLMFVFNRAMAKKINSDLLKATATDSLSDSISTSAVLLSVLIGKFTGLYIDGYVGVIVALLIAWSGIKILKETASKLIGQAPDRDLVLQIKTRILSRPEVLGIHDLNIYSYGPNKYFASVHIEVDANVDVIESHEVIDEIEREFLEETNVVLTGHLDPIVINDEEVNDLRKKVSFIVKDIDEEFSMHDFRIVRAVNYTNLIFEVAVPFETKLSDGEIEKLIKTRIKQLGKEYRPVIIVEKQGF